MNITVLPVIMRVIQHLIRVHVYVNIYIMSFRKEMNNMNRNVEKEIVITQGEYVTATTHAEEFHLTPGQQYKVLGYNGDILIKNDLN